MDVICARESKEERNSCMYYHGSVELHGGKSCGCGVSNVQIVSSAELGPSAD